MKNSKITVKKKNNFTNPSRNSVLKSDSENLLGIYLKEIASCPFLSSSEEKIVAKKAKEGDLEAKKLLVQANLKLVVTIARKAIHIAKIPMIDLIQEGNLGLMIAAEKFNWKLGYKFSTYASWWIKQSMFKAISEQAHCMKIPVYIQETLSKFSKIKSQMENKYNCQVKTSEVAQKMNIPPDKIESYLSAYSKTVSLESGFENENGKEFCMADILEDEKANVFETVEYEGLKKDIEFVVSTLKEREQEVVRMRYGLGNFAKKTLEEIGNLYGVTKECIRQTELRALKKMKGSAFGSELLSCYIAG
ncbi:MAG TPA: RNA polymerase sigma factor RpoD/SigA [Candidatus Gastranaerophilaceae bacterium]|nr:RNA polymerase sigma factor RpoD/SigA [Candidatus Gastranaerophilaceae bacterium]HPT41319.1 RNA polymerase sigma factor RpoD/SigA [Candidatus Gastranaerophilaceae bacterium]